MPIVMIDQDLDIEATIVQLSFGDRLGTLIDMVTWLFKIYLCSNSQTVQFI
ncbi:ACT domain-containing protein [Arachis hypogaea]|nr:ACT domain-containing protein [Arachis hypogaea]